MTKATGKGVLEQAIAYRNRVRSTLLGKP